MAPRERRPPIAKTPYPKLELPDDVEIDLEHSAANVHLEDGPAALSRHSLNCSYPKGADAREKFRRMLRVYSLHTVTPYEQEFAWRVVSRENAAVPPLQPLNSRHELTYRKCFNTPRSKSGWCCVNECSRFCNSRYTCKFCYPVEHPLYYDSRSFAPPCRCSCDVYRHDVMWTSVGQGTFHYESPNARMCSFIDSSSGRTRIILSKVTWLVEDGFAMVPEESSVRCHACLFTEEASRAVLSRENLNRAHGKYSPFCAFVSRPFDTAAAAVSFMLYHRSFMSLRAIRYVPDENCDCYDVRMNFWQILHSATDYRR